LDKTLERIYFRRNAGSLWFAMSDVERYALAKGLHGFYIEGNAAALKQWFHVATKVRLANRRDDLITGVFLMPALLSDNEDVIQAAARATTDKLHKESVNPLYPGFHVRMIQQAILGEDDALRVNITKLAKNGEKRYRKPAAAGTDFYSLLLAQDKERLQSLVQEHANVKSADILFEESISYLATLQTKLCWRRGIELEIDSPLVPMVVMPVRRVGRYDDVYEFVNPEWVPPRQGILGRLERLFRKTTIPHSYLLTRPLCADSSNTADPKDSS
jgi:hypothetical protein